MALALSSTNLVKTYGRNAKAVHALQGVSINVEQGEIFSLLGPNGAGKTTLIKCVLGIIFPNGGSGSVLGYPLGSVKAKEQIGYLPENHRYPLHLTGEQVLDYFGKLSGINGLELKKRIDSTLGLVGMSDWRKTRVRKYSKGMMQRLGLAQALLNDPALIMLDEPTDGVDPVGRKEIRDILNHIKNQGKTIFLNSHLLSEVERISDRVAIMDHGTVIREGTVDVLTSSKNIYEIRVEQAYEASTQQLLKEHILSTKDGLFETGFDSLAEMNKAIDTMRAQGILIESIQGKKTSLEDVFINLVKSSDITRQ